MPLCNKIKARKNNYYRYNSAVLGLLRWDLVPRWTITINLDYSNYHNSLTHDDT